MEFTRISVAVLYIKSYLPERKGEIWQKKKWKLFLILCLCVKETEFL